MLRELAVQNLALIEDVRDNSPPDATLRSGRAGSPGLAVSISSRQSAPWAGTSA